MSIQHARVLVVDDDPSVRHVISEWLKRKEFRVLEAEGGRQAMETIRRNEPDLVVSDIVMPGMDGVELLNETRAAGMNVPFLMISGYPSRLDAVKVMKQGALDYLAKPFHPETLTRRIRRLLLNKSTARSLDPVKGIMLGTAVSAILWACIIGTAYALFS